MPLAVQEWGDDDVAHAAKVVAYVHRHLAQRHHLKKQVHRAAGAPCGAGWQPAKGVRMPRQQ